MSLKRVGIVASALLVMGASPQDPLVRARQLYNVHEFDAAIAVAREARQRPELADAAAVVLGRSHLERHRTSFEAADLDAARESFVAADTSRLAARDRRDLMIGLGELLYFEGHYGAAAETFGALLDDAAGAVEREHVLDWWAMALDHEAQMSADAGRRRMYMRILERVESAASGTRPSAAALYWLAAAAAGADDVDRAWHAAIAAWIRAPLAAGPHASLRADLERLVQQVIIPSRALAQAPAIDPRQGVATMQSEWAAIKNIGIRR